MVICNVGIHWNIWDDGDPALGWRNGSHYDRTVRQVLQILLDMNRHPWRVGMYRETLPQHFLTRTGDFPTQGATSSHCMRPVNATTTPPTGPLPWRHQLEWQAIRDLQFPSRLVAPQLQMLIGRADAHVGMRQGDCSHYCFAPGLWAGIIDPVIRTLQNAWVDAGVEERSTAIGR